MKNPYDIIRRPLITEKTTMLIDNGKYIEGEEPKSSQYTFEVMQGVNKTEVKKAVETIFPNVKVLAVNIINVRKKERKVGKYTGFRPAVKKAIVTLAPGQNISEFEI